MSNSVQAWHKVVAVVAAVAITALLQGTMLAGFDRMAAVPTCTVVATQSAANTSSNSVGRTESIGW